MEDSEKLVGARALRLGRPGARRPFDEVEEEWP
jgi:hypothetical protein